MMFAPSGPVIDSNQISIWSSCQYQKQQNGLLADAPYSTDVLYSRFNSNGTASAGSVGLETIEAGKCHLGRTLYDWEWSARSAPHCVVRYITKSNDALWHGLSLSHESHCLQDMDTRKLSSNKFRLLPNEVVKQRPCMKRIRRSTWANVSLIACRERLKHWYTWTYTGCSCGR